MTKEQILAIADSTAKQLKVIVENIDPKAEEAPAELLAVARTLHVIGSIYREYDPENYHRYVSKN